MNSNSVVAILTSVCTAGSTTGVAITALVLSNTGIGRVEASSDKINANLEMLTGSQHDIDKRLSIVEDRAGH
jgi:hypothetical protein